MKKKNVMQKIIIICFIMIFVSLCVLIYPSVYENICKKRVYKDFEKTSEKILEANICIIKHEADEKGYSYSTGASGVIIGHNDNMYYAFTAYHVIKDNSNADYLVQTYTMPTASEYHHNHPGTMPTEYYKHLPSAEIVYICEESDIAIIKFSCEDSLIEASISNVNPSSGMRVMCIGQDSKNNSHFIKTYGEITSKKTELFACDDDQKQNEVYKMNAYGVAGFSGGGVFDENMNLLGINIGGGTDGLGRFKYEVMIPGDQLIDVLGNSGLEFE